MASHQGAPARYVQWGRGKSHVTVIGEGSTLCGMDLPQDGSLRAPVYKPALCSRCKAKDTDVVAAAERDRKERWEQRAAALDERLQENRAGKFIIARCKLCGLQHISPPRVTDNGVAFCMREGHAAELEMVEAAGPAWTPVTASTSKESRS